MDKTNMEKIEYVAVKDLEEQTKVVIEAVDSILTKRLGEMELRLDKKIGGIQDELYVVRDELKADINNVQTLIDGYVKAQEDFKLEFVIMKEEVKQMKQIFKEKLGVEIRAI